MSLSVETIGVGPPVLFCHGFPDTARVWRRQMLAVAAAGYQAIAFDMRGYGRSSAPSDADQYTALQTGGDIIAILDALACPSATLVGHDFGAHIAWNTALMRTDRIAAVFGVSVPHTPRGDVDGLVALRAAGRASFYMFQQIEPAADERWADAAKTIPAVLYWTSSSPPPALRWSPFDPELGLTRPAPVSAPDWADRDYVAYNVDEFQRTGFNGGLNYYRALGREFELTAAFKGAVVRQPSFFLAGKDDGLNLLSRPASEQLRAAMPGLIGNVEIEDAGHWPQLERPEIFTDILLDFLAQIRPVIERT